MRPSPHAKPDREERGKLALCKASLLVISLCPHYTLGPLSGPNMEAETVPGDQRPVADTSMDIDMDLDLGPEPEPEPEPQPEPIQTVSSLIHCISTLGQLCTSLTLVCDHTGRHCRTPHRGGAVRKGACSRRG